MTNDKHHMMKAVQISSFGEADQLVICERPMPLPVDGEVLIAVEAAGVNRPDILQRLGKYPPPEGITDIPGLEVAGTIIESRSDRWQPGDKVCALLAGGGYAEYACAPASQCLPVPKTLSMIEAAGLPETVFTVWNNLFNRGNLAAGQKTLIHGGASGIGTTAIQMAKAIGATVAITAGTNEKCQACCDLGADLAINYKQDDFAEVIEGEWGHESVNVILDMVGGSYVPKNIRLLAPEGRHVSIAFLNGNKAEIDIMQIMKKRLVITGSTLRNRPVDEKAKLGQEIEQRIWPLVNSGQIIPKIFATFTLSQAAKAHKTLEEGEHIGKIVLTTNNCE